MDHKIPIIKNNEIDLHAIFQVLWNKKKSILQITVLCTFIGIIYSLLLTPLFKSSITMYPVVKEESSPLSQIQGMASSFGLNLDNSQPTYSISDIVQSRRLKTKLIYHNWTSKKLNKQVNLIQYWEINKNNITILNPIRWIKKLFKKNVSNNHSIQIEAKALEILNNRLSITETETGLIQINIVMEEPQLAADIANFMYDNILDFTINIHNKQAKQNREFIENRQLETKNHLALEEELLKKFRQENRRVLESPQLQLELERLLRNVEIQTQIYLTLKQQYELARIEEVKETPSVIILDNGIPAHIKHSPNRKLIVILTFILGIFLGTTITLFQNYKKI